MKLAQRKSQRTNISTINQSIRLGHVKTNQTITLQGQSYQDAKAKQSNYLQNLLRLLHGQLRWGWCGGRRHSLGDQEYHRQEDQTG